ncbi:hypothetical protein ABG067_005501 [Albugo candida]
MEKETTADYGWAMDNIKKLFNDRGIDHQLNFVTNRELALMTALSKTYRFYYVVGISAKNIFAKQRTALPLKEYFDRFLEDYSRLVTAYHMYLHTGTNKQLIILHDTLERACQCLDARCPALWAHVNIARGDCP